MKVKITLAWVGVVAILAVLVFFTWKGVENFTSGPEDEEGFLDVEYSGDLNITTCPAESKSYVDNGGRTVCCDGEVQGGVCSGKTICSLSEQASGTPTCSEWFGAYLDEKGKTRCPISMPHYYENAANGVKGCTSGPRLKDGTGPADNTSRTCKLYTSEEDDLLKIDSCTNQKIYDKTQCFTHAVPGTTKKFLEWGSVPPPIFCSALDKASLVPTSCLDDSSFSRTVDYWVTRYAPNMRNWKEQSTSWGPQWKLNFCSVIQKLNLDKTIKFGDLDTLKVF